MKEELIENIKKIGDVVSVQHINDFYNGTVQVTNKGVFKVSLGFPANECLKNPKCIPMKIKDYKVIPLLLFVKVKTN